MISVYDLVRMSNVTVHLTVNASYLLYIRRVLSFLSFVRFSFRAEWATGYTLNIIAVVLWFLAGASCYVFDAPVVHAERPVQEQTVTYTQNADGTVSETNVVIQGKPVGQEEPKEHEIEA